MRNKYGLYAKYSVDEGVELTKRLNTQSCRIKKIGVFMTVELNASSMWLLVLFLLASTSCCFSSNLSIICILLCICPCQRHWSTQVSERSASLSFTLSSAFPEQGCGSESPTELFDQCPSLFSVFTVSLNCQLCL